MNLLEAIGATCWGVVIGWLVRYFIRRFKTFTPIALGSIISMIAGGGVLKFLEAQRNSYWFYLIGLLIGFVIYTLIVWHDAKTRGNDRNYRDDEPMFGG